MATRWTNSGLIRTGKQTWQSTNYNVARYVRTISVDDSTVGFAAADTALNTGGAVANMFDQAITTTPTESAQSVTATITIATTDAIFTVKRVAWHDDTTANVTTSSTTLCGGIDGQSLTKTADFTMQLTLVTTYSSV